MRIRRFFAIPLAAPIVALMLGSAAQAAPTELVAAVGPGFTITLMTASGKPVTRLNTGSYGVTVGDDPPVHTFRLLEPGVNKARGVAALGRTAWTISLEHGKHHFQGDPHEASMKGNFSLK